MKVIISTDWALTSDQGCLLNRKRRCPIHVEPKHYPDIRVIRLIRGKKNKRLMDYFRKLMNRSG